MHKQELDEIAKARREAMSRKNMAEYKSRSLWVRAVNKIKRLLNMR